MTEKTDRKKVGNLSFKSRYKSMKADTSRDG